MAAPWNSSGPYAQFAQPYAGAGYGGAAFRGSQGAPVGYNGTGYGYDALASIPAEKRSSGGMLSGLQRKPYLTGQRRRLHIWPVLISLFLPWGFFIFVYWVSSFPVRYDKPWLYDLAMLASALLTLAFAVVAVGSRLKMFSSQERDPSWLMFVAVFMIVALVGGYHFGDKTYKTYMRPYLDFSNLNSYTDIYPNLMRGQQLMDAGVVVFTNGTRLDISKSEGFKEGTMYCVAPISFGNVTLKTYDFWAVGTNCCSGSKPDFHCEGWNSDQYGGLRLMNGGARGKYRLAVQQAEATYGIKAAHPLFFEWTRKPLQTVDTWQKKAYNSFPLAIFAYGLLQAFCVTCATLAFSRIGYL